jgi:thiol-disulfide isomerase/thioredoxin
MTTFWPALVLAFTCLTAGAEPVAKVMIFVATDCPIANSYAPELNRLHVDYGGKMVEFLLVYPDPDLTEDDVKKHLAEYALTLRATIDRDHALVKKTGVTTTPEVAVFDTSDAVVYRGRIDNLYADYGERRRTVTEPYLRDALDAILRGEKPAPATTEAIGCLIERIE